MAYTQTIVNSGITDPNLGLSNFMYQSPTQSPTQSFALPNYSTSKATTGTPQYTTSSTPFTSPSSATVASSPSSSSYNNYLQQMIAMSAPAGSTMKTAYTYNPQLNPYAMGSNVSGAGGSAGGTGGLAAQVHESLLTAQSNQGGLGPLTNYIPKTEMGDINSAWQAALPGGGGQSGNEFGFLEKYSAVTGVAPDQVQASLDPNWYGWHDLTA